MIAAIFKKVFSTNTVLLIVAVIALVGAGYYYINELQREIVETKQYVRTLETAVAISEESVSMLQREITNTAQLTRTLQAELQEAEASTDQLRATLQRHNLARLSQAKPGLIETRINNATNQVWDDITADTTVIRVQSVSE